MTGYLIVDNHCFVWDGLLPKPSGVKLLEPNHDLIQDAAAVFAAISEALDQAATPIIAATGLPASQIRVLYQLHYQPDVIMGQVAQHLDLGLPTASYHVERLVEAGLVERAESKTDRRSKVVSLTPKGQALINSFLQGPLDHMAGWLAQIKPEELAMLLKGLQALAQVSISAAGTSWHSEQGN